ncbi:hypothetical protein TELCIR_12827 [Teladorsagia circumcincta]|uniref:Uncharacterized protein n=1 Tax=Teladorsagia circumcincta TaxID=45464 RepID=A0A2G9U5Q0_TELCI|nr:hypothetical protein TELCIR_12827 [Teladorsagia circumcincta]
MKISESVLESIMQELHKNDASFNESSTEMVKMVSELKSRKGELFLKYQRFFILRDRLRRAKLKARIRRMFRSPRNIRRTIIFMEIYMASVLLLAGKKGGGKQYWFEAGHFDTNSITSKHNCSPCVSEAELHKVRENIWLNSQRSHCLAAVNSLL